MPLTQPREWLTVSNPDPDDHRPILVDITFMMSNYNCIYGRGCPGAFPNTGPVHGCCSTAPYFNEDEVERMLPYVARLGPKDVDNFDRIHRKGWYEKEENARGGTKARLVDGHCIFLNTGKTAAPGGCAFHAKSLALGENFRDGKPEICWQVPIFYDELDDFILVQAWDRDHAWGDTEGDFMKWWCMEEEAAYTAKNPIYISMEEELSRLLGKKVYKKIREHCEDLQWVKGKIPKSRSRPGKPVSVFITPKPPNTPNTDDGKKNKKEKSGK